MAELTCPITMPLEVNTHALGYVTPHHVSKACALSLNQIQWGNTNIFIVPRLENLTYV